jgi:hypothetical protein
MRFGLFHPLVIEMSHCICNQPFDPMGIHILHYVHGGKRMASHNVVWDVFTTIARDVRFYVLRDQTHVLLFLALQYSCHWIDIVLYVDGVCMLVKLSLLTQLSWFGFMGYYFSWGYGNNWSSSETWYLLWLVLGGHAFPSSYRGFQMFTPIGERVSSLMCQHGVGSEGHWRFFFLNFAHIS